MKKMFFAALAILTLSACQKQQAEEIKVSITYSLDASVGADMTKSTDAEVFDLFYAEMKAGSLVAPIYELTFTETTTGAKYEFKGKWDSDDMITIRTGKYKVEGISKADGYYLQDKATLKFNQEIEISTSSTSITLDAAYDCFLLAFAKSDIKELKLYYRYYGDSNARFFSEFEGYYYGFVNDKMYADEANRKEQACIVGTRENESEFKIYVGNANLEKGKYYIYNDVSNLFELPKMDAGI